MQCWAPRVRCGYQGRCSSQRSGNWILTVRDPSSLGTLVNLISYPDSQLSSSLLLNTSCSSVTVPSTTPQPPADHPWVPRGCRPCPIPQGQVSLAHLTEGTQQMPTCSRAKPHSDIHHPLRFVSPHPVQPQNPTAPCRQPCLPSAVAAWPLHLLPGLPGLTPLPVVHSAPASPSSHLPWLVHSTLTSWTLSCTSVSPLLSPPTWAGISRPMSRQARPLCEPSLLSLCCPFPSSLHHCLPDIHNGPGYRPELKEFLLGMNE